MKTLYYLLLTFVFTAASVTAQIKRTPEPAFNPTGSFSQVNDAIPLFPKQKNSSKPQGIELEIRTTTFDIKNDRTTTPYYPYPPEGSLMDKDVFRVVGEHKNQEYKFNKIELNGLQIIFTTETADGISYRFSGRFLKSGRYHKRSPRGIALKGSITRIRNGKEDGTADIEFSWLGRD